MFKKYLKYFSLVMIIAMLGVMAIGCSGTQKFEIGVTTGTTYHEWADKFENVDVMPYKDDTITLWEVHSGRVDAIITDRIVGTININERGYSNLKLAGGLLYEEVIAVAIRKDDDSLRQAINKALADMIADGTYTEISKKYFGIDILDGVDYKITFPDEEPANDTSLQRVKDAGEIQFAMSGGYPPFNYFTEDTEELIYFS